MFLKFTQSSKPEMENYFSVQSMKLKRKQQNELVIKLFAFKFKGENNWFKYSKNIFIIIWPIKLKNFNRF